MDNDKAPLLWEMGNQGGVSGDVFAKVAYDPQWVDSTGATHPGRVRILPLNAAFCLTPDTEILTRRGWLSYDQLSTKDEAASLDPETNEIVWTSVEAVNVFDWDGPLAKWSNERFDVLSTPDHRWLYRDGRNKESIKRTEELHGSKHNGGRLVVGGGDSQLFSDHQQFSDDFVKIVGWFVTEGHWFNKGTKWSAPGFTQSSAVNRGYAGEIDALLTPYGSSRYLSEGKADQWYVPELRETMLEVAGSEKRFGMPFLSRITREQAEMLFEVLIKGDGSVHKGAVTTVFHQSDPGRVDDFQTLCMMLGKRTHVRWRQRDIGAPCADVTVYSNDTVNVTNLERTEEHYEGKVWCPTTGTGMWVARRKGITFHTGNCFPEFHPHDRDRMVRFKLKYRFWSTSAEGTRQVYTYVEILTDDRIEEYVNDELIDSRANPLGMIPVVHQPNILVSSSPWGLSDISDIVSLNREYNEKATDISEIINYHAAPITIIKGAKSSNLEKGARKVWGGLPKDADVFNLTNGVELAGPLQFLETIKRSMHELTGVPESALGQMQPISNTSGVALSIMYMPAMQRHNMKKLTYTRLLQRINELALRTLFLFEPNTLTYDPNTEGIIRPGQSPVINPADPMVYQGGIEWSSPLPIDALIKLNEIQAKMALGLESKRGALKDLNEAFPDEKMQEIFEELVRDARDQGALDLLHSQISAAIMAMTGIDRSEGGPVDKKGPQEKDADGNPVPTPTEAPLAIPPEIAEMTEANQAQAMADLVTQAYGTKLGSRIPVSDS